MRGPTVPAPLLVALLVALPLSGCIGGVPDLPRTALFALSPLSRGDPTPLPAADCDQLLDDLNARALRQARVALEQSVVGIGHYALGDVAMAGDAVAVSESAATGAAPAPSAAKGSASQAQVTGTNNQEAAADEGDILKTDGEWTYVLARGMLRILHSTDIGDIEAYAQVPVEGYPTHLLLEPRGPSEADDRLVVVLQAYGMPAGERVLADEATSKAIASASSTRILVLSLADRRAPQVLDDRLVEGHAAGVRLVDGTAYVVVQSYEQPLPLRTWAYPTEEELTALGLDWEAYYRLDQANQTAIRTRIALDADVDNQHLIAGLRVEDHLPFSATVAHLPSSRQVVLPDPVGDPTCRRVLSNPDSTGRAFTTVVALSVAADAVEASTTRVAAASAIVYASSDSLVLAAPSQDAWWFWAQPDLEEATDLHWLTLDGLDVRPRASGRVAGTVLDSFSLDVHGERLRVATTTGTWGRWWLPSDEVEPMLSHVAVLQEVAGQLVPTGMVGGIAPGERIWSARFTDERAYLVTFRNMDPLWVIDLTGSTPRILGELEIPGVSTYIHPLDDDALLAIGYGPRGEDGEGLDWSRIQVSLFDVSDPARPRRADVLDLAPADGWTSSGATQEHKAFTYWPAIGTLAVPLSTYRDTRTTARDGEQWRTSHHVGLKLVTVDRDAMDLRVRGEVDQDVLAPDAGSDPYGYYGAEVQRSYFLGLPDQGQVSVYAMSELGMTAHDLATLGLQGHVAFR